MLFGLKNAEVTFWQFMDKIFANLYCVYVCINDILTFNENEQLHMQDIDAVFNILSKNNLKVPLSKCESLDFLGYNINANGIKPTTKEIKNLQSFLPPTDVKSLHKFLGMINIYRKWILKFAELVLPLTVKMLNSTNGSLNKIELEAFNNIIKTLSDFPSLAHPTQPNYTIYQSVTDSGKYMVSVSLHQLITLYPKDLSKNFHKYR